MKIHFIYPLFVKEMWYSAGYLMEGRKRSLCHRGETSFLRRKMKMSHIKEKVHTLEKVHEACVNAALFPPPYRQQQVTTNKHMFSSPQGSTLIQIDCPLCSHECSRCCYFQDFFLFWSKDKGGSRVSPHSSLPRHCLLFLFTSWKILPKGKCRIKLLFLHRQRKKNHQHIMIYHQNMCWSYDESIRTEWSHKKNENDMYAN